MTLGYGRWTKYGELVEMVKSTVIKLSYLNMEKKKKKGWILPTNIVGIKKCGQIYAVLQNESVHFELGIKLMKHRFIAEYMLQQSTASAR